MNRTTVSGLNEQEDQEGEGEPPSDCITSRFISPQIERSDLVPRTSKMAMEENRPLTPEVRICVLEKKLELLERLEERIDNVERKIADISDNSDFPSSLSERSNDESLEEGTRNEDTKPSSDNSNQEVTANKESSNDDEENAINEDIEDSTRSENNFYQEVPAPSSNSKYPEDTYSFLYLHGPFTEPRFFFFGLLVFLIQGGLLGLLLYDRLAPNATSRPIIDGTNKLVPPNVETTVKVM